MFAYVTLTKALLDVHVGVGAALLDVGEEETALEAGCEDKGDEEGDEETGSTGEDEGTEDESTAEEDDTVLEDTIESLDEETAEDVWIEDDTCEMGVGDVRALSWPVQHFDEER